MRTIYCSFCASAMDGRTRDGLCSERCRTSNLHTKRLRELENLDRQLRNLEDRFNRMTRLAARSPLRAVGVKGT